MNTEKDYLEEVFEKTASPQEHLPLKPVRIWLVLLSINVIIQVLGFVLNFEVVGFYALTFFCASGLMGVCTAWMVHSPSRINLVKTGLVVSIVAFIIYFIRASIIANYGTSGYVISGIVSFFGLPAISFILYYFYSKTILKRKKEISAGLFAIRQTPPWQTNVKSTLSLLVILIGFLLGLESPFLALLVVLLGIYYRFYKKGLDINTATQHYLFYTRHFWHKQGTWLSYNEHSKLTIATPVKGDLGRFQQETYSGQQIKRASLFLTTDSEDKPRRIYKFSSSERPFKEAQDLAEKMGISLEQ